MSEDFRKFEEFMNRMFEDLGNMWNVQGRPLLPVSTGTRLVTRDER